MYAREHAGLLLASPPHVFRKPPPPGVARATNQRYTAVQHGSARGSPSDSEMAVPGVDVSSLWYIFRDSNLREGEDFHLFLKNRIFRDFYRALVSFGYE